MGSCMSAVEDHQEGMRQAEEWDKSLRRNRQGGYVWTTKACAKCGFGITVIAGQGDRGHQVLCTKCAERERKEAARIGIAR